MCCKNLGGFEFPPKIHMSFAQTPHDDKQDLREGVPMKLCLPRYMSPVSTIKTPHQVGRITSTTVARISNRQNNPIVLLIFTYLHKRNSATVTFFSEIYEHFLEIHMLFSSLNHLNFFKGFCWTKVHFVEPLQSDPLNSYSLNSSFSLNSSGKFGNFESIIIDVNVKLPS